MTRLTEEMVIARSKQSDLASIKKLNCWGSELSDVSIIKQMRGVEVLALSVNKISTLKPFEDCKKLQELYLRKNNIQDINEIAYLQSLPALKYLWLEENPCCDKTGPNYRAIVLRALPNLIKLDNVVVTQREVDEALRNSGGSGSAANEDDTYEDANEPNQQQQQEQHQQYEQHYQQQQNQQHHRQQQSSQHHQQQQSAQQQYSSRRSSSPMKELSQPISPENTEESISEPLNQASVPSSPSQEQPHPTSPKSNSNSKENRNSYPQFDRSPGSDQESSPHAGYRERVPIPPSMSTHSMKEYYQSDRPAYPAHYRHSQTDLTEWEEHQHHNQYSSNANLHPGAPRYAYRNGSARENGGDWEESERPRSRRPDGRFGDSAGTVSTAVLNHYSGYHRRPINRSSNLLSATLCLVKELDYSSLEVVEHAVRCRIDELSAE